MIHGETAFFSFLCASVIDSVKPEQRPVIKFPPKEDKPSTEIHGHISSTYRKCLLPYCHIKFWSKKWKMTPGASDREIRDKMEVTIMEDGRIEIPVSDHEPGISESAYGFSHNSCRTTHI